MIFMVMGDPRTVPDASLREEVPATVFSTLLADSLQEFPAEYTLDNIFLRAAVWMQRYCEVTQASMNYYFVQIKRYVAYDFYYLNYFKSIFFCLYLARSGVIIVLSSCDTKLLFFHRKISPLHTVHNSLSAASNRFTYANISPIGHHQGIHAKEEASANIIYSAEEKY